MATTVNLAGEGTNNHNFYRKTSWFLL